MKKYNHEDGGFFRACSITEKEVNDYADFIKNRMKFSHEYSTIAEYIEYLITKDEEVLRIVVVSYILYVLEKLIADNITEEKENFDRILHDVISGNKSMYRGGL